MRKAAVGFREWTIRCDAFPMGQFFRFTSEIGARHCDRRSGGHRRWRRIIGQGYVIWLTDVTLADSSCDPPVWKFRLETLTQLNAAGQETWDEIVAALNRWCERLGLRYEVS